MTFRRSAVIRPLYDDNGRKIFDYDFVDMAYEQWDGLDDKIMRVVDIRDFGGLDDYGVATPTNNHNAFAAILAAYPNGCTIKLPKTPSGSGAYYLDGVSGGLTSVFTLDPDVGVSFYCAGSDNILGSAKTTKPFNVRLVVQGYTIRYKPEMSLPEKNTMMSRCDAETAVIPTSINPATACRFYQIDWSSYSITTNTPTSVASDSVVWSSLPANSFVLATLVSKPGDEAHAYFGQNGYSGSLCIGVITDKGFSLIRQDSTGGNFIIDTKSGTSALVTKSVVNSINGRTPYWASMSMVGIRINSYKSFSLLLNGIEIARVDDTGGTILYAGWGGGFETSSVGLQVGYPVELLGKKSRGIKPIKVVVCGDSITAAGWPALMQQYLAGMSGTQIISLLDLSVPGATSVGQQAALDAADITGYDYCLIQVGVNDIQLGYITTQFTNYISAMIDKCETNGVIPIIGIPSIWYEQADAAPYGNIGQASLHSADGAIHRMALLRLLAERGVKVNMLTLEDMGAILPSLLTTPNCDSIVVDNIHPTIFGSRILGFCWAKILAGELALEKEDSYLWGGAIPTSWIATNFSGGFYSINRNIFSLDGTVTFSGGATIADGTTMLTLPESFRPNDITKTFTIPVAGSSGTPNGVCTAMIDPTAGTVKLYSVPSNTVYLFVNPLQCLL